MSYDSGGGMTSAEVRHLEQVLSEREQKATMRDQERVPIRIPAQGATTSLNPQIDLPGKPAPRGGTEAGFKRIEVALKAMTAPTRCTVLPNDAKGRKRYPVGTGVLDYFPDAIAAIARVSFEGNEQHNPGEPLHWARGKSMDQDDTMQRHYLQRGSRDTDGQRHSAKMAWRALAILQLEIEADGEGV